MACDPESPPVVELLLVEVSNQSCSTQAQGPRINYARSRAQMQEKNQFRKQIVRQVRWVSCLQAHVTWKLLNNCLDNVDIGCSAQRGQYL